MAHVSDAVKLKDLNDIFNEKDDTTLIELETSLRENKNEIIVCADGGTSIAGVCCISIINTMCFNWQYCFITELFVREEHRNRGIGKQLMKFAEDELKKEGLKRPFFGCSIKMKQRGKYIHRLGLLKWMTQ